jgi:beta-galactosidase
MGTEIYWHGILDYSNRENRRIREVKDVHEKLKKMKSVAGSRYTASVGIVKDYDNVWDAQLDVWHKRVDKASLTALFEAAQLTHTPVDYVYLTEDMTVEKLEKYEVLFYPHATIMNPERAKLLQKYVEAGGTLVFGCRSGYKDLTGKCVMDKLPGLLSTMTGTDITEYSFIAPDAETIKIDWDGTVLEASIFTDLLAAANDHAKIIGTYVSDYYAGEGALICNKLGEGTAYYYGTAFNTQAAKVFLEKLGVSSPFKDLVEAPQTCEIAVRVKDDKKFLFILNYMKEPADIILKQEGINLYTGGKIIGNISLSSYGTLVVEI